MPELAQAALAVPAAAPDEVPLSPAHAGYLASEAGFATLIRLAFRVSLATPILLFALCVALTKRVARVPLIGWLLGICGAILTVLGVILGVLAVPLVFLAVLPVVLLNRRSKLREDLAANSALRQSGSFQVSEDGRGGAALVSTHKRFRLSRDELEGLRPALTGGEQGTTLIGAVVHAANAGDLLAAYDDSGRQLIGVAA
jgi:hypothetical protein